MGEHDPPNELREELRDVVAALRTHLAWRRRGGAWSVSAQPSRRRAPAPEPVPTAAPIAAAPGAGGPARPRAVLPVAGETAVRVAGGAPAPRESLAEVRADLGDCERCKLHAGRQNIVFGVGDPAAPLMFVGEGPGAEEDRRGEPFVGRAGQLLDRMIAAMGWSRDGVYIANVVKCRPPNNRDPEPDEVEACNPFLMRQIDAIQPRVIVTLGRPAAHLLLRTRAPISRLRGRWQEVRGIRVMPTFHPAFLLRSPDRKREAWDDLKLVIAELARLGIEPPNRRRD